VTPSPNASAAAMMTTSFLMMFLLLLVSTTVRVDAARSHRVDHARLPVQIPSSFGDVSPRAGVGFRHHE
jgi:hypothetical protein